MAFPELPTSRETLSMFSVPGIVTFTPWTMSQEKNENIMSKALIKRSIFFIISKWIK